MQSFINISDALKMHWDAVSVHFAEIGLKGKNRGDFIKRLKTNIEGALHIHPRDTDAYHDRILIRLSASSSTEVLTALSRICGIAYVTPVKMVEPDMDHMSTAAIEMYTAMAEKGASFGIHAQRSNKKFPHTSNEIGREVGAAVIEATGAPVNLSEPDVPIRFRINEDSIYLEGPRIQGPGGMPVGVSGRVLCLFSGGIDSPAAAWLMMKRGCRTDFLHFHVYGDPEQLRDSKIVPLIQGITQPQGQSAKLHLAPYTAFEVGLLQSKVPRELELILFRRFMAKVASVMALRKKYHAIVTGDNLAQVASQTMQNLAAFDDASEVSVFRPLLTYNKQEIIDLTKDIGTFKTALEKYKDCCSIVAKHPHTNPKLEAVRLAESKLPLDDMIASALEETVCWKIAKAQESE